MKTKNELYFVNRPSLVDTSIPTYYYTFAESVNHAIRKVSLKYGEYDDRSTARKLSQTELDELVIGLDNYYG